MIAVRLVFYVLYMALGVVIVVRMLSAGPHWQILTGVALGLLLIGLGAYRLSLAARLRSGK